MRRAFGAKLVDLRLIALAVVGLCTMVQTDLVYTAAVKPAAELRLALAFLGAQRFIPWSEVPSGGIKHYQILVYDSLVGCTDNGQLSAEGGVAQAWQEAADQLSWTFTLRKGIKFHDGTELPAEDAD